VSVISVATFAGVFGLAVGAVDGFAMVVSSVDLCPVVGSASDGPSGPSGRPFSRFATESSMMAPMSRTSPIAIPITSVSAMAIRARRSAAWSMP